MKTAVITGANRGIGLALVNEYRNKGWRVIGICRQSSAELDASGAEVISGIDVTDALSVSQLPGLLKGQEIDLLINNAGILRHESLDNMDFGAISEQFMVNALAPLRVATALLNQMAMGSKLAFITSRMGSISDNSSGGYYGYRMSKAALNAAATSLALDLKPRHISVAILHPGFVQTAMVNFGGEVSPQVAAQRLAQRIEETCPENTGGFWHANGECLPW